MIDYEFEVIAADFKRTVESLIEAVSSYPNDEEGMFYVAIFSLITTIIVACFSLYFSRQQTNIQKETLNGLMRQIRLQQDQWKHDVYFREQQKSLIEFRKKLLTFTSGVEEMLNVLLPCIGVPKNQDIKNFSINPFGFNSDLFDESDAIFQYKSNEYLESPADLYDRIKVLFSEFALFIDENELYLEYLGDVYGDINSLKTAFKYFFDKPAVRSEFVKSMVPYDKTGTYVRIGSEYLRLVLISETYRSIQIRRKTVDKNGHESVHNGHMSEYVHTPMSGFIFSDENIRKAAKSEKFCLCLLWVYAGWFRILRQELDASIRSNVQEAQAGSNAY